MGSECTRYHQKDPLEPATREENEFRLVGHLGAPKVDKFSKSECRGSAEDENDPAIELGCL